MTPRHGPSSSPRANNGAVFANAPNRISNGTGLHAVAVPARTVAKTGDRNQHRARDIAGLREVERTRDARIYALAP